VGGGVCERVDLVGSGFLLVFSDLVGLKLNLGHYVGFLLKSYSR
jgi:hypothetical protein